MTKRIMAENFKILLPSDGFIRKSLEDKLKEYRERLSDFQRNHPCLSKKQINDTSSVRYKISLAEKLFEKGEIDTSEIFLELKKEEGEDFNIMNYMKAVGVIKDYCLTGGRNVSSPTGFPRREGERYDITLKMK
jgi:hypothetical protein